MAESAGRPERGRWKVLGDYRMGGILPRKSALESDGGRRV